MWYVDIPDPNTVGDPNDTWVNVNTFQTKAEAIAFAKENFGADDEGNVGLVSGNDEEESC